MPKSESSEALRSSGALEPPLVDWSGAGLYLGVSPRLVRELWQRRELTGVKIGRRVRFSRADLDDYIRRHRIEAKR